MTPFDPTFRRLLRRNIPQLKDEDLNRHESLIALRHHLVQEKHVVFSKQHEQPPEQQLSKDIDDGIAEMMRQAQSIFTPCAKAYDASLRLWVVRRQLTLQQGNFFQVPTTVRRFKLLAVAIWNCWKVQLQTFPTLAANRIKYYVKNLSVRRALGIAILVALLIIGLYTMMPKEKSGPQQDLPNREQQLHGGAGGM